MREQQFNLENRTICLDPWIVLCYDLAVFFPPGYLQSCTND